MDIGLFSLIYLFTYLFCHLFILVWAHSCLDVYFILWVMSRLCCCSNCCSLGHWELLFLAPVSLWHLHQCRVWGFFALFCFLAPPDAIGTSCIFSAPVINSARSPGSPPWFLFLDNGIRNQDLGIRCACCFWSVIASSFFNCQNKEVYVCPWYFEMRKHTFYRSWDSW